MKIKHVGNTRKVGNTIIKRYEQHTSGSAYKKVAGDILFILDAGFLQITIEVNPEHPNLEDIKTQITYLQKLVPVLKLTLTE